MIKSEIINIYSGAFFTLCNEQKLSLEECLDNTTEIISLLTKEGHYFWNWLVSLGENDLRSVIAETFLLNVDQYFFNFLQIVLDDHVFYYFLSILQRLEKLFLKKLNHKIVQVYSVVKLDAKQLQQIQKNLTKRLNNKICLFPFLDKSLIAGVRVESENFVFDNSVRKKIIDLEKNLLFSEDEMPVLRKWK